MLKGVVVLFSIFVLIGKCLLWCKSPFSMFFGVLELLVFSISLLLWLYYLLRIKKNQYLLLLPIVLTYQTVVASFSFWEDKSVAQDMDATLSVMNFNSRVFSYYDSFAKRDYSETHALVHWAKQSDADVICFQEFICSAKSKHLPTRSGFRGTRPYDYLYVTSETKYGVVSGMIIYSKYPIINKGKVFEGKPKNQAIYVDIVKAADTIRVYNVHLQSFKFTEEELLGDGEEASFLSKLTSNSKKRYAQVDTLLEHLNHCSYPLIIAGDFNDTPYSYTYHQLNKTLNDAHLKSGGGYGGTFHHKVLPNLRIDYQFYNSAFSLVDFTIHDEVRYSDHFPVSGTYLLKRKVD